MARVHNIFVIHSFRYDGSALLDLLKMLRERPRFEILDHSIPDVRKYQGTRLRSEIRKRIAKADVVLAITRPAVKNSDHIKYEFSYATGLGKPVVALVPPGLTNIASFIRQKAVAVVNWDVEEIVAQIKSPGTVKQPPQPQLPLPLPPPLQSAGQTPKDVLGRIRVVDHVPGVASPLPPPDRSIFERG